VILCDTGPLVTVCNSHSRLFPSYSEVFKNLPKPLLITWAVFTETMYFLSKTGGWNVQEILWRYYENNIVSIYDLNRENILRIHELMTSYKDTPMSVADASLVVVGEVLRIQKIFTTDSDFNVYRLRGMDTFEIIRPES
jgi:uncharacterized protein